MNGTGDGGPQIHARVNRIMVVVLSTIAATLVVLALVGLLERNPAGFVPLALAGPIALLSYRTATTRQPSR